jgi:hypothetical protein
MAIERRASDGQAPLIEGGVPSAAAQPPTSPACPFCSATQAELVSAFACQHLTSHWRCRACWSYFEAVRDDR